MKTIISNIKIRIAFLKSIIKMFILEYTINGNKAQNTFFSELSKAEEYMVNLRAIRMPNANLKTIPIRNLLSLTKFEKLKFIIGLNKLHSVECVAKGNPNPYKIHLIASSKLNATALWRNENKNDTIVNISIIEIYDEKFLSLAEMIKHLK